MTQSMIERCTEAVARARGMFNLDRPESKLEWVKSGYCAQDEQIARTAIGAMREPTEAMWSGLARQIILWDRQANPGGDKLYKQLKMTGCPIPEWLPTEIPNTGHCPSKGNVAVAIWKAMHDGVAADG